MAARRKDSAQTRLFLLLIVFIASLAGIAARLVVVQHVQAAKFSAMAIGQRLREVKLSGERGSIYDRDGQELAVNRDAASVYATPYFIKDPATTAFKLAPILNAKPSDIEAKLRQKTGFVYLARQLDMDAVNEIKSLKLAGINYLPERKRYYPNGTLAAHTLGFAGVDNQGLAGVESVYDNALKGQEGRLLVEGDPAGAPIPGGIYSRKDATQGDPLYLTIDKDIQYKAEVELNKVVKDYSAKGGSVIVMDPKTGEILALASAPGFDPNAFGSATDAQLLDRAVGQVYEPGSTAKVITASAAIEEKAVGLDEVFSLPAGITVAGQQFGEYDDIGKGDQTIAGIVALSSNVGTIELAQRLGKTKLYKYMTGFGLGSLTGVDLTGEEAGVLPAPDEWSDTSIATIPYGQGVSGTSLQMVNVVAAIANDGLKPQPHVMKRVDKSANGGSSQVFKTQQKRVISEDTARKMQAIMVDTVEKGTGKNARVAGYEIGGKTGTAQKAGPNGYEAGKLIVTFAGYVSNLDPQLAIIVSIDEPQATGPQPLYAATIAAPVFRDIAEFSIKRLKIAPGGRQL
jgi:cell division protein FtsI/penicillin-binding protein 2